MAMLGPLIGSSLKSRQLTIQHTPAVKDVPKEQHPSIANLFNVKLGEQQMNESMSF